MAMAKRVIDIPGGVRLPCIEQGSASGPPVLLLHGYTDSCRSFELLLPHLPGGLRAIAPSQRGHGDGTQLEQGYAPEDFATDTAALLDVLGIGRAVVVGHSMGSQAALRLALDHPARVSGIVLIGGFATLRGNAAVQAFWDETVAGLTDPVDPDMVEVFQRGTVVRPIPNDFLRVAVQESLKLPARLWRTVLRAQMEADLTPELGHIAAPTLLLWGDQDAIVPRSMQEILVSGLPSAQLDVLTGTGHAPHWEEPERVAAAIAAFVASLTGRYDGHPPRAAA